MAGSYTEIVEIVAPSSAVAGQRVDIEVRIKNTYSAAIGVMAGGALEYGITPWPTIDYPDYQANVAAGATHTFYGHFTMPDNDVTIHAYSYWYGSDGAWHFDDEKTKEVNLTEAFKGTISKKELEYDEARADIPAHNVLRGERGLVHIWGRNDMSTAQRMGIYWIVKDPDGLVVEEYFAWEMWPYTGAGKEHEFIGGRFDLNKPGTYTINAGLLMNPDNPTYVDTYYGSLCTVVPESEFSQFEITDYSVV